VKIAIIAGAGVVGVVVALVAAVAGVASTVLGGGGSDSTPSQTAMSDIPGDYLGWYQAAAATCPGLSWTVLAGIGKVETDHGRSTLPGVHSGLNEAGVAAGPMQFEPATFAHYDQPVPPGGANPPSLYDPVDAIYAAARMLCVNGARNNANIRAAIFSYNHADWYVSEVLNQAAQYASAQSSGSTQSANPAALQAINYALGQRGLPYEWGGTGPPEDHGFDCSGLTQAAYAAAGISLPHNADAQYRQGSAVPAGAPLLPGDLVFYGTQQHIHHVGLYLGNGQMVDAPDRGKPVQIQNFRWPSDGYAGATRPAEVSTPTAPRAAR
jgi:cell wall-associated NlpC family hydrolase